MRRTRETRRRHNTLPIQDLFKMVIDERGEAVSTRSGYSAGCVIEVDASAQHIPPDRSMLVYSGHNVEFSGQLVKLHAEQAALRDMLQDCSQFLDSMSIKRLGLFTNDDGYQPPCGHCLQEMSPFTEWDTLVTVFNVRETNSDIGDVYWESKNWRFEELLPEAY